MSENESLISIFRTSAGSEAVRGFTLIEVLVSIALIGVMLLSFQSVFLGTPLAKLTKNKEIALTIAKHKLADLRAQGYSAISAGSFSDARMSQLASSSGSATGTVAVSAYADTLKQVAVSVSWSERGTSQSVSLTTLVAQTGGLP